MKKLSDIFAVRDSGLQGLRVPPGTQSTRLGSAAEPSACRDALQGIIDAVPAMINVKDCDLRYIFMNSLLAELYGVEPNDAIDKTTRALVGPEHGTRIERLDREVIESGAPIPFFEERIRDPRDVERVLLTTKVPLLDRPGKVIGIVTVSMDISEHKDAENALRQSEARSQKTMELLANAVESMNDGFILADNDNRLVMCNRRFREMYPENADRLISGAGLDDIVNGVEQESSWPLTLKVREQILPERSPSRQTVYSMVESVSGTRWIEARDQLLENGRRVGMHVDVTERKISEEALAISEQRYRSLFEAAPISMWEGDWSEVKKFVDELTEHGENDLGTVFRLQPGCLVEAAGKVKVLDVNKATLKLYNARAKAAFIRDHHKRLCKAPWATFQDQVQSLANGQLRVVTDSPDMRWNGDRFHVRVTLKLPEEHRHDWSRVFAAVEDVTQARALSQQLRYQATHDALTGLVNRREFEVRLQRLLESTEGGQGEYALCYMDLDQFKIINDTSGHVAGDELLRRIGQELAKQVRQQDTLARLGGDEFGVLLVDCSMQEAERVANALRRTIEDFRLAWKNEIFEIGVSVGVVPIRGHGQTISDILSAADTACYSAKERGRNRVHLYHEGDLELTRRHGEMRWVTRLQSALEEDRFELVRQDIVAVSDTSSDKQRYELLLRMRDESGSIVQPGTFLPAAERYGLSVNIDRWVVREAFKELGNDKKHLEDLVFCSINLSGMSLSDDSFLAFVVTQFAETGLPPEKICFDIAETAAIGNLSGATCFIEALGRLGCRFALDDFGSGLSSFAYLKKLPVDFLKIDGIFVKDIVDDSIDRELVRSINQIGHVMGKKTIAEFVENEAILGILREMGVDYAQGFAFGKPRLTKPAGSRASQDELARADGIHDAGHSFR